MLEDVLPKGHCYKIEKLSFINDKNFYCTIRCKIDDEKEFRKWLKEFETITNTSWIHRYSVPKEKSNFLFSKDYVCQHSSYRKTQNGAKNKNCTASLTARIKRNSRFTRYRDVLLKDGFFTIIKINFQHSHEINSPEAWNWLRRSEETKRVFIELFNCGISPYAAKNYHETLILSQAPNQLANSRINPPIKWIYDFYQKWMEENYERLNNEPNFKRFPDNPDLLKAWKNLICEELKHHPSMWNKSIIEDILKESPEDWCLPVVSSSKSRDSDDVSSLKSRDSDDVSSSKSRDNDDVSSPVLFYDDDISNSTADSEIIELTHNQESVETEEMEAYFIQTGDDVSSPVLFYDDDISNSTADSEIIELTHNQESVETEEMETYFIQTVDAATSPVKELMMSEVQESEISVLKQKLKNSNKLIVQYRKKINLLQQQIRHSKQKWEIQSSLSDSSEEQDFMENYSSDMVQRTTNPIIHVIKV